MTGKEIALPLAVVTGLLTNAVVVGVAWGKMDSRTQAVTEIRETVKDIQKKLEAQDGKYLETYKASAELKARLEVLEKAADTQAAINLRLLAHLEGKGD